jgi:hypothetical protein
MRNWPDDVLWDAAQYGPDIRGWFINAVWTAVWAGVAAVFVLGSGFGRWGLVAVLACTAAVYAAGFAIWLRDVTTIVEVRVVGTNLRLLTATGRRIWQAAQDVTELRVTRTPFFGPDTPGAGTARMWLELRGGSVRYRGRWTALDTAGTELLEAAWRRVCPSVEVTHAVKSRGMPGGDYD